MTTRFCPLKFLSSPESFVIRSLTGYEAAQITLDLAAIQAAMTSERTIRRAGNCATSGVSRGPLALSPLSIQISQPLAECIEFGAESCPVTGCGGLTQRLVVALCLGGRSGRTRGRLLSTGWD